MLDVDPTVGLWVDAMAWSRLSARVEKRNKLYDVGVVGMGRATGDGSPLIR